VCITQGFVFVPADESIKNPSVKQLRG